MLAGENKTKSSEEMIAFWQDWIANYPIVSIEDGLDEEGVGLRPADEHALYVEDQEDGANRPRRVRGLLQAG